MIDFADLPPETAVMLDVGGDAVPAVYKRTDTAAYFSRLDAGDGISVELVAYETAGVWFTSSGRRVTVTALAGTARLTTPDGVTHPPYVVGSHYHAVLSVVRLLAPSGPYGGAELLSFARHDDHRSCRYDLVAMVSGEPERFRVDVSWPFVR